MKFFSNLKGEAMGFVESYKAKGPASYAAAQQAIGGVLIADGLVGLEAPFGGNKRPGIFGTLLGIIFSLVFIFIPTLLGNTMNLDKMTSTTQATVVSVGTGEDTCSMTVNYLVNGQEYTKQSSVSSSGYCSYSEGETVEIFYDPSRPGSWIMDPGTISGFLKIFFWAGILLMVSSLITFFIRLLSIIFGYKLLRNGRKNAAALPPDTNMQTMIAEIKKNFTSSVFGFGAGQNPVTTAVDEFKKTLDEMKQK